MATPRLELQGIAKAYPGTTVLEGLDLAINPGEVVSVQGASGTGKSTLLNIVGLLENADRGRITLDGEELADAGTSRRAQLRAQRIGFVFQGFHLLPEFTVLENVLMPARAAKRNLESCRTRALALLDQVGLRERSKRRIQTLSGGEAQRVALCRALVLAPGLILADEPTGNLDPSTATSVLDLLIELVREQDSSVLLVTHDPDVAARADRQLMLAEGRLHPVDQEAAGA